MPTKHTQALTKNHYATDEARRRARAIHRELQKPATDCDYKLIGLHAEWLASWADYEPNHKQLLALA